MLYESYKSSLEKRKNFIIKAWKFRFLILAAFLSVAALMVFLCVYICGLVAKANEIRCITITTDSATWVYDGLEHSLPKFEITSDVGLFEGHTVSAEATSVSQITDGEYGVGFVDNVLNFTISDRNGKDVTARYDIRTEWGKLRIKSPVEIVVYSLGKLYDGTPLSYGESDFEILKLPPDVDKCMVSVSIEKSLTEVGEVTLDELKQNIKVTVSDGDGKDVTSENRIDILGGETALHILPREIEVTSVSISRVKGNTPLSGGTESGSAWISKGTLAAGHRIEISVSGVLQLNEATAPNTISGVCVFDEAGNDVTGFYRIEIIEGLLSWQNP